MLEDKIVYVDPLNSNKILNIEGSCQKYCIDTYSGIKYLKFSTIYDVFAEVLSSKILQKVGIPAVQYDFVKETNGEGKLGTISDDYSQKSKYRVTLDTIGKLLEMIDKDDMFSSIFCDVSKAKEMIDRFCAMRPLLQYSKEDSKNIELSLYAQVIGDYFLCNGDHHTQNIECLVYQLGDNSRKIVLGPAFDFGNCLRSAESRPALTMDSGAEDDGSCDNFAHSICNYFTSQYNNPEDLSKDPLFILCCNFMNLDIFNEIYSILTGYVGMYDYKGLKTSRDSFYELIIGQLPAFNQTLGCNLKISDLDKMAMAYNGRVETLTNMFLTNQLLGNAYLLCSNDGSFVENINDIFDN